MNGIALSGKRHVGKTTAAAYLAQALSPRAWRLSFGDILRDDLESMVMEQYLVHLDTRREKELVRPLLMGLADLLKALLGPRVLVNRWVRQYQSLRAQRPDLVVVVDDVRYPDELDALRDLGLVLVRLVMRPQAYQERVRAVLGRDLSECERLHSSETALDGCEDQFDYVLDVSDLTLDGLRQAMVHLVEQEVWD